MFNIFKKDNDDNKPKEQEQAGLFGISVDQLKNALSKTSESLISGVMDIVSEHEKIDDDMLDEMEEKLIRSDLGVDTATDIIEKLRNKKNDIQPDQIKDFLKNEFVEILKNAGSSTLNIKENQLNVILITGVNGAGKTTLIGKLAYRYTQQGKKVIVAAGDTFRAAAEEQLDIWSKRAGAQIVRKDGADAASVVFDAIKTAKDEQADILLIDTAGRLQNKLNLMEELKKIKKVIDKEAGEDLVESMLVIDANTGQNALTQAEVFTQTVNLTSVALTKLDGSAKGGIIIGIAKELKIPVKLIGIGEKMEDMKDFCPQDYTEALFG